MKKCPNCNQTVGEADSRCRYCGEMLTVGRGTAESYAGAEPEAPEMVDVWLLGVGADRVEVIRIMRFELDVAMSKAEEMCNPPIKIAAGMEKTRAEAFQNKLKAAGATIELRPYIDDRVWENIKEVFREEKKPPAETPSRKEKPARTETPSRKAEAARREVNNPRPDWWALIPNSQKIVIGLALAALIVSFVLWLAMMEG